MAKHLQNEIEKLKKMILSLSGVVEEACYKAVRAVEDRNESLAREVLDGDDAVDRMEVDVEEECLKILALHQPVAVDLRFIIAVLKIDNDLERVGDLAVNMAEQGIFLTKEEPIPVPFDLHVMAEKARSMLKRSLDALVNLDAELAKEVCGDDDEVDEMHKGVYGIVWSRIQEAPKKAETIIHYLTVSRQLERIADHATNIAEDVIYMVEGEITRHRMEEYLARQDEESSS